MDLSRTAGLAVGALLSPLAAAGARARDSRLFHPVGVIYRARAEPAVVGAFTGIAQRLSGPALLRFSGAWWKRREWPDVLGIAIRFRRTASLSPDREPGDFDLLLATIRKPWTTLLAPLSTRQHDFLANDFYAVSPFRVAGLGRAALRLVPEARPKEGEGTRWAKLQRAVEQGRASFALEGRAGRSWEPIARVTLGERVAIDDARLRFQPWIAGRGVVPSGFVHALRPAAYRLGQRAWRGET